MLCQGSAPLRNAAVDLQGQMKLLPRHSDSRLEILLLGCEVEHGKVLNALEHHSCDVRPVQTEMDYHHCQYQ